MDREDTYGISGRECVSALCRHGFVVRRCEPGWTFMQKGKRIVAVPDLLVLTRALLEAILGETELTYGTFLALLDDTPTMPDLKALVSE